MMENYEQKYKEAIDKIKELLKGEEAIGRSKLEEILPELKEESKDERIRRELINAIKSSAQFGSCLQKHGFDIKEILSWVENQGKKDIQVILPTFTFDDILALQCCMKTAKEVQKDEELYNQLQSLHDRLHDAYWFEKQGSVNNEPKFKIGDIIIAKPETCMEHEPFNITNISDGFYWDGENSILVENQDEFELCKVKPKFKVGDWIYHEISENIFHINKIENDLYVSDEGATISFGRQNDWRLWTIQDAKEGDVLASADWVCIFKRMKPHHYNLFDSYCELLSCKDFGLGFNFNIHGFYPATENQRDLLFQKMKEAGYEWDAEKEELKKIRQNSSWNEKIKGLDELETYILSLVPDRSLDAIKVDAKNIRYIINKEQNPAWSEEDECMCSAAMELLITHPSLMASHSISKDSIINWLKSLKDKIQPKQESEWDEEDIRNIQDIDSILFYDRRLPEDTRMRLRNWVKSLKDRIQP